MTWYYLGTEVLLPFLIGLLIFCGLVYVFDINKSKRDDKIMKKGVKNDKNIP